jgi:hypothetical protein
MVTLVLTLVAYLRAFLVPRHKLTLEAAALRQQLAVFKRKQSRPKLRRIDRLGASCAPRSAATVHRLLEQRKCPHDFPNRLKATPQ